MIEDMLKKLSNAIEAYADIHMQSQVEINEISSELDRLDKELEVNKNEIITLINELHNDNIIKSNKFCSLVQKGLSSYNVELTPILDDYGIRIKTGKPFYANQINIDCLKDERCQKIVDNINTILSREGEVKYLLSNKLATCKEFDEKIGEQLEVVKSTYIECIGEGIIHPKYRDFCFAKDACKDKGRYVFENKTNFKSAQTVVVINDVHYMITEQLNPNFKDSILFVSKIDTPTIDSELNALESLVNNDNVSKTQLLHQIHKIRYKFNNNGIYYVE